MQRNGNNLLTIKIPKLHQAQQDALNQLKPKRFGVLACGRRWGKSFFSEYLALTKALKGGQVAYAAPNYGMTKQWFRSMVNRLGPVIKNVQTQHNRIELLTGGVLQCFTLDAPTSIRGNAFDLFIIDEASFAPNLEDTWNYVIRPTLVDREGKALFISSPFGFNDFWKFSLLHETDDQWVTISMPSSTNPRLPRTELESMKASMPSWVYESEVEARFIEVKSNLFRREWIQKIHQEDLPSDLSISMGVDLAISKRSSADYTAICVIGTDPLTNASYILNMTREKLSFRETLQKIIALAEQYKPNAIAIESVSYQQVVADELLDHTSLPVIPVSPTTDKITRSLPAITRMERGDIYILDGPAVDPEFYTELMAFPSSKMHDDTIDAMNMALLAYGNAQNFFVFSL